MNKKHFQFFITYQQKVKSIIKMIILLLTLNYSISPNSNDYLIDFLGIVVVPALITTTLEYIFEVDNSKTNSIEVSTELIAAILIF